MTLRTFLRGGSEKKPPCTRQDTVLVPVLFEQFNRLFQVQEVNPEFLAALPPKIQEEVLAQQRLEQQRCSTAQVEKTTITLKLKFTKSRWTQPPQWTQGSSFKPCLLHCASPSSPIRRSLKSLPCLQSLRRRLKTCAGIMNRYF